MTDLRDYYEGFFNNSVDAILILNNNSFIHFNKAALDMFGYTEEEFKYLKPSDVSPEFQPDGQESQKKAEWMILLAIKNGHNRFEWVHKKKDGTNFNTEVLLIPVIEKSINIYAVVRDISEKKKMEFEIKKLNEDRAFVLENIDIFLYRYNRQGLFQYISPSVKKVTGYDYYEWRDYLRFLTDSEINDNVDENITKVLSYKQKVNYNIEIYRKDGKKMILNLDEKPYFNENGELDGVLGIGRDITEELKKEGQIYYAQKMETLSNLASGFTHEVNNSLAVLKGNIDIIRKKLLGSDIWNDISERFNFVDKSMTRIIEMMERLLILSNKYDDRKEVLDLNDFILNLTDDLKNVFTKNIDIEVKFSEEEAKIYASRYYITQLFLTILVNSYNMITFYSDVKKTKSGKIKITINEVELNNEKYWEIIIQDDIDSGHKYLNMEILKSLVEHEKGKLYYKFDKINTYKVYFKVYSGKNKEDVKNRNLDFNAENSSILIIDDELLIVKTASEILKNYGFDVLFSLNGFDGLKLYEQNRNEIDLVVIDMDMPKMDGRELYYKLKELNKDIKIIVSSGYRDDKRVLELIENEKVGFIPKPYSMKLFLEEVIKKLKED